MHAHARVLGGFLFRAFLAFLSRGYKGGDFFPLFFCNFFDSVVQSVYRSHLIDYRLFHFASLLRLMPLHDAGIFLNDKSRNCLRDARLLERARKLRVKFLIKSLDIVLRDLITQA